MTLSTSPGTVVVLGIFAADLAFRAERMPRVGETLLGHGFNLGPGGKGSNQAVAAARSGAMVRLISQVGDDPFGSMALDLWEKEGIDTRFVIKSADAPTGAAFIFVDSRTGDNAIIVESGAAGRIRPEDVEGADAAFHGANVFLAQLEQPIPAALRGLELARAAGLVTILNPAPAAAVPEAIWPLCDYVTPNESEASAVTGVPVVDLDSARRAGDTLLARGIGCALLTLGEKGVLVHTRSQSVPIPALASVTAVDTTGAGDAFNGGFAAAIAGGESPLNAARFGCAVAGISVSRHGTARAMPTRAEVEALLASRLVAREPLSSIPRGA